MGLRITPMLCIFLFSALALQSFVICYSFVLGKRSVLNKHKGQEKYGQKGKYGEDETEEGTYKYNDTLNDDLI